MTYRTTHHQKSTEYSVIDGKGIDLAQAESLRGKDEFLHRLQVVSSLIHMLGNAQEDITEVTGHHGIWERCLSDNHFRHTIISRHDKLPDSV